MPNLQSETQRHKQISPTRPSLEDLFGDRSKFHRASAAQKVQANQALKWIGLDDIGLIRKIVHHASMVNVPADSIASCLQKLCVAAFRSPDSFREMAAWMLDRKAFKGYSFEFASLAMPALCQLPVQKIAQVRACLASISGDRPDYFLLGVRQVIQAGHVAAGLKLFSKAGDPHTLQEILKGDEHFTQMALQSVFECSDPKTPYDFVKPTFKDCGRLEDAISKIASLKGILRACDVDGILSSSVVASINQILQVASLDELSALCVAIGELRDLGRLQAVPVLVARLSSREALTQAIINRRVDPQAVVEAIVKSDPFAKFLPPGAGAPTDPRKVASALQHFSMVARTIADGVGRSGALREAARLLSPESEPNPDPAPLIERVLALVGSGCSDFVSGMLKGCALDTSLSAGKRVIGAIDAGLRLPQGAASERGTQILLSRYQASVFFDIEFNKVKICRALSEDLQPVWKVLAGVKDGATFFREPEARRIQTANSVLEALSSADCRILAEHTAVAKVVLDYLAPSAPIDKSNRIMRGKRIQEWLKRGPGALLRKLPKAEGSAAADQEGQRQVQVPPSDPRPQLNGVQVRAGRSEWRLDPAHSVDGAAPRLRLAPTGTGIHRPAPELVAHRVVAGKPSPEKIAATRRRQKLPGRQLVLRPPVVRPWRAEE